MLGYLLGLGAAMKKSITVVWLLFLFTAMVVASPPPQFGSSKPKPDNTRLLTGKVLDHGDNPLPNAVVYLTNTRTRAVKTYIVSQDGSYRFPSLQDRKSTRLNSSHLVISYAVFCLKKKK